MNLVKWLRKNNRKLMAVIVVLIMISFVLGSALQRWASNMGNSDDAVWLYNEDSGINRASQNLAEAQLKALEAMGINANALLAIDPQTGQIQQKALTPILLSQMLFPSTNASAQLNQRAKTIVMQSRIGISESDVDKFFEQASQNPPLNWILLNAETKKAGVTVLKEQIQQQITQPEMQNRVSAIAKNLGMEKDGLYQSIADFMAVRNYVALVCSNDDFTTNQIRNILALQNQAVQGKYALVDSAMFVDYDSVPSKEQVDEQFGKFKDNIAGNVTDENPFGFGYKLPDRVQIEYATVNIADIKAIAGKVTEQETETFYQEHAAEIVETVLSDPNDPNSPTVRKILPYAKVATVIKQKLERDKIEAKADEIINAIIDQTDKGFANISIADANAATLKANSVSYADATKTVSAKYKVKINAGITSLLSAGQLGKETMLGSLALTAQGKSPVSLIKLAFSIDELGESQLPFGVKKLSLYESTSMLKDRYANQVAIARVTNYSKAQSVDAADVTVEIKAPLGPMSKLKTYTIRDKVIEDLGVMAAMRIAKQKADKIADAGKDGLEKALEEFNAENIKDANEYIAFVDMPASPRMSLQDLADTEVMAASQPGGFEILGQIKSQKAFTDNAYKLIDAGTPAVVLDTAKKAYYVFQEVSCEKMNEKEYADAKNMTAMTIDFKNSMTNSMVLLMPENLKKRLNFRLAEKPKKDQQQQEEE